MRKVTFTEEQVKKIQKAIYDKASSEDEYPYLYDDVECGYSDDSGDFDLEIELDDMPDVLVCVTLHSSVSAYSTHSYTYWDDGLQLEPGEAEITDVDISHVEIEVCDWAKDAEDDYCEHSLEFDEKQQTVIQRKAA